MGKSKKPFIDKKNSVTFHLVHRSQHDPLVTDPNAPQRVLMEATVGQPQKQKNELNSAKRKEEQQKYGIHFDDDYDYLQHLKKSEQEVTWEYVENPNQVRKRVDEGCVSNSPKIELPSSVFATEFEENEGILNKAVQQTGPRPDWDPEIVAALDDDFDFENVDNQLEDDFVLKAMEEREGDTSLSESDENESEDCNELMDRLGPLVRGLRFDKEETKSRFTEYSMSSSVIRRNEQLKLLDERFERFYATYDDPELGDLATEEIAGSWHQKHPYVINCFKQLKKSDKVIEYNKEWDNKRLEKYRYVFMGDEDPNAELTKTDVNDGKEKKWDCESILSTYSNTFNQPKVIDEPKRKSLRTLCKTTNTEKAQNIDINPKTGIPSNVFHSNTNQLTEKALSKLEKNSDKNGELTPKSFCAKSTLSTLSVLSIRPKDEIPEEKKARKRLLREYRNERRIERKANTQAFKEEKRRQANIKINQQGNKIF